MPRWVWFVPLGGVVLALAAWGFRLGWIAATITETDVIETWTAQYIATHAPAARATDCVGQPGPTDQIWILVSCVTPAGERVDYPVNRFGRLMQVTPVPGSAARPET